MFEKVKEDNTPKLKVVVVAAPANMIEQYYELAQAMGLGFATLVDPASGSSSVLSAMFTLLAWALFLGAGGHLLLIETIVASYRAIPTADALFQPHAIAGARYNAQNQAEIDTEDFPAPAAGA